MSDDRILGVAPIGEQIQIWTVGPNGWDWFDAIVKFCGNEYGVLEKSNGNEVTFSVDGEWRYPVDPIEQLENKLLDKWRSQGIDYAHDDLVDIPQRWILQTLVDAGADIDAI